MGSNRISVRVPEDLTARLRARSRAKGTSESNLVRQALEKYLSRTASPPSAYELAERAGIVGIVHGAPRDLGSNPRHFKGFGKGK